MLQEADKRNRARTIKEEGKYDANALEGGSFEETLSRASLISGHLSGKEGDYSEIQTLPDLTFRQIVRWYDRGSARFKQHT